MKDKIFIDTNLWIYLYLEEEEESLSEKFNHIKEVVNKYDNIIISNQILNEFSNILYKKYNTTIEVIKKYTKTMINITTLHIINEQNTFQALDIIDKYSISFYDALILSSALNTDCEILFTEDMHHNQLVENKLRIINPFVE